MIKRADSPYVPGRPKGLWYKWKHDPHIIDAVLMYAQRGHGKRSSFYSDFTFGVWRKTAGEDEPNLAQSLVRIEHDKDVHLKIVPLFPVEDDQLFFEQFVPKRDFVKPSDLRVTERIQPRRRLIAGTPWPLLVVGGLLLLALAANELACGRLHLPRPRTVEA